MCDCRQSDTAARSGHLAALRWRTKTRHLHQTQIITPNSCVLFGCRAAQRRRRNSTTLAPSIRYSNEFVRTVKTCCGAALASEGPNGTFHRLRRRTATRFTKTSRTAAFLEAKSPKITISVANRLATLEHTTAQGRPRTATQFAPSNKYKNKCVCGAGVCMLSSEGNNEPRRARWDALLGTDSFAALGCTASPRRRPTTTRCTPNTNYSNRFVRSVGMHWFAAAAPDNPAMYTKQKL